MSEAWKNTVAIDDHTPMPPFKRSRIHCTRCHGSHTDLLFMPFTIRPSAGYTHFATCPETREPLLTTVVHYDLPVEAPKVEA